MIIDAFKLWLAAIRAAINPSLALFASLYALLLASLYIFVSTREATVLQVLVTFVFLALIPAEFFILQASILSQAHNLKWRAILINAVKLFVVTIPIVIIGYVIWVLLNKWQIKYPVPRPPIVFPPAAAKPQQFHWPSLLSATLRGLLFAVLLPLVTIHLWIEVVAHDVRALLRGRAALTLKRFGQVMFRAFTSSAAFIYGLGLILFALIPYGLLVMRFSPNGTKTDFAFFIVRLLLVFAFSLVGWVVTVIALAKNVSRAPEARQKIAPGVSPGTPALQSP